MRLTYMEIDRQVGLDLTYLKIILGIYLIRYLLSFKNNCRLNNKSAQRGIGK